MKISVTGDGFLHGLATGSIISRALYFDDPDGNGLEVYVDAREERDRETWRGQNEPFDPTA